MSLSCFPNKAHRYPWLTWVIVRSQWNVQKDLKISFSLCLPLFFFLCMTAGCGNQPGIEGQSLGLCQWGEAKHKHKHLLYIHPSECRPLCQFASVNTDTDALPRHTPTHETYSTVTLYYFAFTWISSTSFVFILSWLPVGLDLDLMLSNCPPILCWCYCIFSFSVPMPETLTLTQMVS